MVVATRQRLWRSVSRFSFTGWARRDSKSRSKSGREGDPAFCRCRCHNPARSNRTSSKGVQSRAGIAALFGSYDDEPGEPNFLSQYRNLLHHYVHQQGREDASTFWGGCGAIRRDVFLAIGGLTKGMFRPSVEDIELGTGSEKPATESELCKSLQVKHLKRWDLSRCSKPTFFSGRYHGLKSSSESATVSTI